MQLNVLVHDIVVGPPRSSNFCCEKSSKLNWNWNGIFCQLFESAFVFFGSNSGLYWTRSFARTEISLN